MKHINESLDIEIKQRPILDMYLSEGPFAVLDIETTGLSPQYSAVILSGLIIVDPVNHETPTAELHQLFAITPGDEEEILANTAKLLSTCKYIVTFNGRFFDVPFLQKRCAKYGIEFPDIFDLDLFPLIKYYSGLSAILPRMNQKAIEEYAGINHLREDRISGGESVDLYNQYLETGSKDLERRILLHNSDDVKQLLRLMDLLKNVDIHKSFYKSGFPIEGGSLKGINLKKNDLVINGIANNPSDYIAFPSMERPFNFQMHKKDGTFEIILPCESLENNVYVEAIKGFGPDRLSFLQAFPTYVNDHIILKEKGAINYPTVNILSAALAELALASI